RTAPYVREPVATNLVSFPRASDGHWISASWRDSRVGYAGGRFAMDVNAIWAPHALAGVATILDAVKELGLKPAIPAGPLAALALLLDSLGTDRTLELVGPILQPYPVGLFVDDLGPVVANDCYAGRDVWEAFRRDAYHSPTVVWGRDVNILLAGLARAMRSAK